MLLAGVALIVSATSNIVNVPDTLAGTGYPPEHGNYLCERRFGDVEMGDTYMLPCVAPREDWQSDFKDTFVITAWWPPTMNQLHDYAAAHCESRTTRLQHCSVGRVAQALLLLLPLPLL